MAGNLTAPATSPSSATTASAIVGNNASPYGAALLGSGTTTAALSSGDLAAGDAGEMGSLPEFAVEFWFAYEGALPGADDVLVAGPASSSAGARQWGISLLTAGNLQFNVKDDGGTTRTANGATVLTLSATPTNSGAGVWYHVVATAQGGNLNIYLNSVVDGTTATWGAHTVRPLGTTAGSEDLLVAGPTSAATNFYFDEIAVYRTGLTAARVLAHFNAGRRRGFYQQLPGTRIGAVLDAGGSAVPRSLQAGTRTVIPAYMSGQSPLSEIQHAVEAEDVDAVFFAAKDGTLTFLADGYRSVSPYNTSQVTLGDGGGAEIPYKDMTLDYSESFLINEWNVTRSASGPFVPVTQTASDATSISRYFERSQSLSDVPTTSDANCATIAAALLAKYKDPLQRVTAVTMQASAADTTAAVLARDLADRITVKRRPPGGGSPISQEVFIEQIEISGSKDGAPWVFKWGVSPQ